MDQMGGVGKVKPAVRFRILVHSQTLGLLVNRAIRQAAQAVESSKLVHHANL